MTPAEMATAAVKAINAGLKMQLVLPRKGTGRRTMRIFGGRGGPLGEVACENAEGNTVVWADPMEVLAYLAANGLVTVKAAPAGGAP